MRSGPSPNQWLQARPGSRCCLQSNTVGPACLSRFVATESSLTTMKTSDTEGDVQVLPSLLTLLPGCERLASSLAKCPSSVAPLRRVDPSNIRAGCIIRLRSELRRDGRDELRKDPRASRGDRREEIHRDDAGRQRFLSTLAEA